MAAVAFAGLAALAVAMGIGRFAFTPLLPLMQGDAGVSLADGGYLAAANYVGYLLGALWAARPARHDVAVRAALIAIALAGGLCLVLTQVAASSAQVWLALGLVALALSACLWPVIRDGARSRDVREARALHWTPDTARLVLCYGAFGFGYIIPATYVPAMAKALVPDPALFGWAWPIFGVTAAISTVVAAPRIARHGNRRVWAAAAAAMALGVAAPLFVPGAAGIVAAAVLVGGTFMVITMAGLQEARAVGGTAGGTAGGAQAPQLMAAMTAAFAAGQIAGPLAVRVLVRRPHGFALALAIAAAALALSAAALVRRERPCPT
jgi:predicted MFS family arabinose efflux permease